MTKRTPPYSPEVRERAVRMVFDHRDEDTSQYEAIRSIAAKIGCSGETLRPVVAGGSPPRDPLLATAVLASVVVTVGSFVLVQPLIEWARDAAASLPF